MNRYKKVLITALLGITAFLLNLQAGEICELQLIDCLEHFNGTTITVPENIVALSNSLPSCGASLTSVTSTTAGAPSVMFVIDNSGSMSWGYNNEPSGRDQAGSRFEVTKTLLDTIYKTYPNAEVGLSIFRDYLWFDKTSADYFAQYFKTLPQVYDNVPNQAYVQMLTLNKDYGGKLGINILKDILATETRDTVLTETLTRSYIDLKYRPNFPNPSSTNINIGMIAAKDAMATAINPKERQFVIFFSDGDASASPNAGLPSDDFTNGTNMPTTFTVFFTFANTVPASIQTMTTNIKNNNYSTSNPNSNSWPLQTSYSSLLALLMQNVMKTIIVQGNPSRLVLNNLTSTGLTDSSFQFKDRFALQPLTTSLTGTVTYHYIDPNTNQGRDSLLNLSFTIRRQAGAPMPPNVKAVCWKQPDLLFYKGTVPITEVTGSTTQLQLHLIPNDEIVSSATVPVSSSMESENLTLSNSGNVWVGPFTLGSGTTPVSGDKVIFHQKNDSLIAVYRNPKLPLDTVRVAIPVYPNPDIMPATATLRDTSGDGHIDRIDLTWTPDTLKLLSPLPSVTDLVKSVSLQLSNGQRVTITPVSVTPRQGANISIIVNENTGPAETGWQSAEVTLNPKPVSIQGNALTVTKVIDGAGPVITRAQYYSALTLNGAADTLRLTLSEPVDCNALSGASPSNVFSLWVTGQENTTILNGASFIGACSTPFTTMVTLSVKNKSLEDPEQDSIAFKPGVSSVVDQAGNNPSSNNRGVMIEWSAKNLITAGTSENPFKPGVTQIPTLVQQYYAEILNHQTSGIVIGINSIKPLKADLNQAYGTADVYDAVGNVVLENLPVKKTSSGSYGLFWDGRNKYNRLVGAGSYLMIITMTDVSKVTIKERIKVGIKR